MQLHGAMLCYAASVHLLVGMGASQALALLRDARSRSGAVLCWLLMSGFSAGLVHTGRRLASHYK